MRDPAEAEILNIILNAGISILMLLLLWSIKPNGWRR